MNRWKQVLRTFLAGFALPFMLFVTLIESLFTNPSDFQCIGDSECRARGTPDCQNCSMYEPRAAYPLMNGRS